MPKSGKHDRMNSPLVAEESRAEQSDVVAIFVILAAAAVSGLLVWPAGNFPLNDDWAYAGSVRHLLNEGRFVLSDWSTPFDLIPILSGALLSKLFGFSHETLRLCTWLWCVAGIFLLYKLLQECGVDKKVRSLACVTLAFSPIHFLLVFSFHTDVPFLSLALGALYFFERSERRSNALDEFWSSLFAAGALLTRQSGAVLFLGFLLWRLLRRRYSWPSFLRLGAFPVAGIVFYAWYVRTHPRTWAEVNYLTAGTLQFLSSPGIFLTGIGQRVLDSLLYAALFCAPFLFLSGPGKQPNRFGRDVVFMAIAVGIGIYMVNRGMFPYLENIFHRHGLGTLTVYESRGWKPAFLWGAPGLWFAYTVLSAAGLLVFLRRLFFAPWDEEQLRLLVATAPLALSTLAGARYFDRYLLPWILTLLLALSLLHRRSVVRWPAWVAAGFWVAISIAGTQDYFRWNRAKWELGYKASEFGLSSWEVANGFDWNAHWKFEANMAELKKMKPLENIGEWEWERMGEVKSIISFSPRFMRSDQLLAPFDYRSALAPRGGKLYLFEAKKRQ